MFNANTVFEFPNIEACIKACVFGRLAVAQLDRDMDELLARVIQQYPGLSQSDYLRAVIRMDFLEGIAEDLGIKCGQTER